ncbi:CHASE3 domain-containing protein [Streptomyces californicus]
MTGEDQRPRTRRLAAWTTRRWLRVGVATSLVVLTLLGAVGGVVLGRSQWISDDLTDVRSPALSTSSTGVLQKDPGASSFGQPVMPESA